MALPSKVLPGFSAALYLQPTSSPTPLTLSGLSTLASVAAIAVSGNLLNIEAMPSFGQEDAVASFTVAGSRQSDKIPTQSAPASMTITAPWNPSDANLLLVRGDAYSGTVERTYVVSALMAQTLFITLSTPVSVALLLMHSLVLKPKLFLHYIPVEICTVGLITLKE